MSRMRYCEISCDVNISRDCWENSSTEPTIGAAVKQARKDGWKVTYGGEPDICPACRESES